MGVAFYPTFEDENNESRNDIDGKRLARAANALAKIASLTRVPGLYDSYSMTRVQMIGDLLDGDPEDPSTYDESKLPEEHWYLASEGLLTVRALLQSLATETPIVEEISGVREDLEALERHLVLAAARNVRWHLVVDA
jgi:hypothetical protein